MGDHLAEGLSGLVHLSEDDGRFPRESRSGKRKVSDVATNCSSGR